MTTEILKKANEINNEIIKLKEETSRIPRQIIHRKDYEESNKKHGYIPRFFRRQKDKYNGNLTAYRGYGLEEYSLELTEEDLQALVDIRQKKILELQKELSELN